MDGDGRRGELTGDLLNTKLTSAKEEEALAGDLSAKIWRGHAGSDDIDLGWPAALIARDEEGER